MESNIFEKSLDPEKQTLVFLHYFGGSGESWKWVIKELSGDYNCLAITLPGFGMVAPLENPTLENFADYVQKEIEGYMRVLILW